MVALTLPSVSAWVVAYVAAASVGAATAGVNPRLTAVERAACLDRVGAAVTLDAVDDVHRLEAAAPDVPEAAQRPAIGADPDRPVVIVFTSGTTGTPKGAWFTDRQLQAVTRYDIGDAVGGEQTIAQYGSTQFAHVGFATKLPWYLRLGTTTHLLDRWRAADVLDLVERERIATIGASHRRSPCSCATPASTAETSPACSSW